MSEMSAVESIFLAAVEKPSANDRAAYLDAACPDPDVRGHVERLLAAHPRIGSFLNGGPNLTEDYGPISERPGTMIGPYKLMEQIGEGGMGLVFVAEQHQPVRRKVALKVIKPGMDTRDVIARFEAERQALAMMDHPHIAKVLDAGTTEARRPYFVMELVRGIPITDYCDTNNLTPRDRLALFVQVCQAVQHAHQKGVIHRDLKPSNIMVAPHDGIPVVKVIDFGVAKALGQQLTEKTLYTRFAQMVGTPLYMSPEQAEVNQLDVDTRSDVYSLGVLLYELLTSTTPFDRKRFQTAAYDEIRRIIREEEPPKPSTRLTSLGATLTSVSARRGTDPGRLSKIVRGELDWIVMRCLEKDRTRRYDTVAGLAKDINRYLNDEAVEARPASLWYRLSKVYKRNRAAVLTVTGFAALLVVGLALVTWKWQAERVARRDADLARRDTEAKAQEILVSDDQLSEANAALDRGGMFMLARQWVQAEAAFNQAIELRPKQSVVWQQRGELYCRMGLLDLAAADYAQAFERRAPEHLGLWYDRGLLQLSQGDEAGYRETCRQAAARPPYRLDARWRFLLARLYSLAPGGLPEEERWLRLVENPTEGNVQNAWVGLYIRGLACYRAGQFEESVRCLRDSLTQTQYVARAMVHPVLAMALHRLGQADAARLELEISRRLWNRWVGETVAGQDRLVPWQFWYDWAEFQQLHREAVQLIDQAQPPDDSRQHVLRGRAFTALSRPDRAAAEYRRAMELAPADPSIRTELFRYHASGRRWAEADAALAGLKGLNPNDADVCLQAFLTYAANGRWDKAEAEHAAAVKLRPDDVATLLEQFRYHTAARDAAKADAAYAAAIKGRENDVPFRIECGNACARFGQWQRARDEYARILDAPLFGDGEINRSAWLRLAGLQLYFNDADGYQRTCAALVKRHGEDRNPLTEEMLVRLCLLHANPGVPPERVHALAERCLEDLTDPSVSFHIAAFAAERAGKSFADAARLEAALSKNDWATQRMALALVSQRRGDFDRARRLMRQIDAKDRRLDPNLGMLRRWELDLETQCWFAQAQTVIQPDRWAAAHDLANKSQYEAAIKAFDVLLKPDHPCAGDWISRSYCHGQLGHWKEARADSARALALDPDAQKAANGYALLSLQLGDRDGYRDHCRRFVERQAASNSRQMLNTAAWMCAFDAAAEAEAKLALPLIDKALATAPVLGSPNRDLLHTRGCILYRIGRFDDALKQLTELVNQPGYVATAMDWLFIAMAHERLGNHREARTFLDQSLAWFAANKQTEWYSQVQLDRFRAEAEKLIGVK